MNKTSDEGGEGSLSALVSTKRQMEHGLEEEEEEAWKKRDDGGRKERRGTIPFLHSVRDCTCFGIKFILRCRSSKSVHSSKTLAFLHRPFPSFCLKGCRGRLRSRHRLQQSKTPPPLLLGFSFSLSLSFPFFQMATQTVFAQLKKEAATRKKKRAPCVVLLCDFRPSFFATSCALHI